jgi:uncharacterized coiled-coil DUF342 family protein
LSDPSNQFERLEEKLSKVIDLFKRTQAEKRALELEVEQLKAETQQHAQGQSTMEKDLAELRQEREDIRTRVEKLLQRIDELTGF